MGKTNNKENNQLILINNQVGDNQEHLFNVLSNLLIAQWTVIDLRKIRISTKYSIRLKI